MVDENHFMLVSLEDSKSKAISEVLGSKTCKKIIGYLSEKKEASQKDISNALNIPMNTLDYNIKKLLGSGFIQKRKNFFWSKKGRKIDLYKLSNKTILISPKQRITSKIKSVLPVAILSGLGAILVRQFLVVKNIFETRAPEVLTQAQDAVMSTARAEAANIVVEKGNFFFTTPSPAWLWFLGGALTAIFLFAIFNWRKL